MQGRFCKVSVHFPLLIHHYLSYRFGCGGANSLHVANQNVLLIVQICDVVAEKNSFGVSGMNFKAWVRRVQSVGEAGAERG